MTKNLDNNFFKKVYWPDVRNKISEIAPEFAKIIDTLSPDKQFPLYLAYYPYGAIDADTKSSLFPKNKNEFFRLSDKDVPKNILKDLGYSIHSTPLGMVLEKQIECFIDLKNSNLTIPRIIFTPGTVFPLSRILQNRSRRKYATKGLLSSTAGARSAFVLPNIGSSSNHHHLQRDYNVQCRAPKNLYDHWQLFKEINQSNRVQSNWLCCVMYFSENWLNKIQNDIAWFDLKKYLQQQAWDKLEYELHRTDYDMIFSMIQQKHNLRPNPYLADTAKHLLSIAIGATPGYIPALDNEALPLDEIQKALVESYSLKKYLPTILQPAHFNFEVDKKPIYYSLLNFVTQVFSPKSRAASNTLVEMRELKNIVEIFVDELKSNDLCSADTMMAKLAKSIEFKFFHNKLDRHQLIHTSNELFENDNRFQKMSVKNKTTTAALACDAQFVRGCVSISTSK